jgi:hypothetical protein
MSGTAFGDGTKNIQHLLPGRLKKWICEKQWIKTTRKPPKQVLVGALGKQDASTLTERALPGLREDFDYLVKSSGKGTLLDHNLTLAWVLH